MTDEQIKETRLYRDILNKVSQFPELKENILDELRIAADTYVAHPMKWSWDLSLFTGFHWGSTRQGGAFWKAIDNRELPREYQ